MQRRPWAGLLAVVVALGLTLAPPSASPAAAATGRLVITAAATYTVDPGAAAVHVSVAATFLNDKPSNSEFFYFWRDLTWAVQPEATKIRVADAAGALGVTPVAEDGFIEAQFRLRRNLLYQQAVDLTITWDLPSGAPRSSSAVRVGEAFATFDLWAWGDPGTSSVTATLPGGYEVETYGSAVERTSPATGVTLRATEISNADEFWTSVTAIREDAFATDELNLPGGIDLVIRAWPEDAEWQAKVRETLGEGMPRLRTLIGLPWPIDEPVEVTEVYTPLLEGYAGIFYTLEDRIDISEDLDPLVIIHEGSHAWFNDGLFRDRWIDEGLADTFAAAVLVEIGDDLQVPDVPGADDEGRIDLQAWGEPGRITDETEAVEQYGYNTSWYVVSEIVDEVGAAKMREIFRAAADDLIAYAGAAKDAPVEAADGWQRFLDLLEEIGGSERAEGLFREYVVTSSGALEMDARAGARAAYAALLETGDGWLPPIYVREPLSSWSFPRAMARIQEAGAVLELRDDVEAAAGTLGLDSGPAFETAYEAASNDLDAATSVGETELEVLAALAEAHAAVTAPLDFVATVGLLDVEPVEAYEEAAAEYEAGRLEAAELAASKTIELVGAGPRVGRERLAFVGGVGLLAIGMAAFVVRRRRHRQGTGGLAAGPGPGPGLGAVSSVSVATRPYGTLAADSPAPPPPTDGEAGPEGGAADGVGPGAAT